MFLKPISKEEFSLLLRKHVVRYTGHGLVSNKHNTPVGYYRTVSSAKRIYVEDFYADTAAKLYEQGKYNT